MSKVFVKSIRLNARMKKMAETIGPLSKIIRRRAINYTILPVHFKRFF